ncbi:MAG TPA: ABC transporter ATP-binding protein [Thermoleophilia bacterium]|nr:ABC transporter ATP-binding protein [Thermoleophilia bacterium]
MRPGPARLAVDGLRVVLAGSTVDVVDGVTFGVAAGEVLGLVGESGSGKTTVALALLGHTRRGLALAGGRVLLEDRDVLAMGSAELRRLRGRTVAYVPQDPASALNPALKVGSQLREALTSHAGEDPDVPSAPERMAQVLAEVRLDASAEILNAYPHQLSGGQQQRIALAMAFSCRPVLIVLDEPTTGLDVATQRHVLDTIRGLCSSYGVAAVYVTHDLAVVAQIADRVAVMYAGQLAELGPTGLVFDSPAHPYTWGLLRAIPSPDRSHVLVGMEGQPPAPGRRPPGCHFEPRCSYALPECSSGSPPAVFVEAGSHFACCIRAEEIARTSSGHGQVNFEQVDQSEQADDGSMLLVSGLVAGYGHRQVLHGVGLTVARRSCVAVVGESGSGKTTLARCIVGLHANWSGNVAFKGRELKPLAQKRDLDALRAVQYVFQNPYTSLNPRKTVGQLVEQPLAHFFRLKPNERRDRVVAALEDAALGADFLSRYPDQLSGGERQRVAIARALIVDPELIVCDEVTSALDVSVQAAIVELLRRLQRERGLSLIFITHNLALVRSIAQQVVVLHQGDVVETGPTDAVLSRPQDDYTRRLLADLPQLWPTAHNDAVR